jgi:aspartokinase
VLFALAAVVRRLSRVAGGDRPAGATATRQQCPGATSCLVGRDKVRGWPSTVGRKNLAPIACEGCEGGPHARIEERVRVSGSNGSRKEIVVLKIGGSILTGTKAFRRAALFLKQRSELKPNERLAIVVSAQKLVTDTLERCARRIVSKPRVRTLDLLWSTGELRSVALLALRLQAIGVSSTGLNVHETGLQLSADLQPRLAGGHLKAALAEQAVVVVPGFLATRWDGVIVSLGRGGSDLSAVLLAIGLRALRCELLKDVPGYFADDPHNNRQATHVPSLSFEEALEMAERGCQLVQPQALRAASEARLPLVIRSMDEQAPVTVISSVSKSGRAELPNESVAAEA